MFFTQEDYKKIEEWLSRNAVRDTEFNEAVQPFEGNEIISFVQNGHNTKAYLKDFVNQLFLLGIPDFVNITEKFDESNISLSRAIQLIPYKSRKIGQVITFLNEEGVWKIYQFKGKRKSQWNEESLWIDLIRDIASKITTLADEEDITTVEENGANVFKFKDKTYNPDNFSGKGYKILRKNIVDGKNVLTQEMINEANTIYEVRYDFETLGNISNVVFNITTGSIFFNDIKYENITLLGNNNVRFNEFNRIKNCDRSPLCDLRSGFYIENTKEVYLVRNLKYNFLETEEGYAYWTSKDLNIEECNFKINGNGFTISSDIKHNDKIAIVFTKLNKLFIDNIILDGVGIRYDYGESIENANAEIVIKNSIIKNTGRFSIGGVKSILFENCIFENTEIGADIVNTNSVNNIKIINCIFKLGDYNINNKEILHIGSSGFNGTYIIDKCTFIEERENINSANDWIDLYDNCNVILTNCHFVTTNTVFSYSEGIINIKSHSSSNDAASTITDRNGSKYNVLISNNTFTINNNNENLEEFPIITCRTGLRSTSSHLNNDVINYRHSINIVNNLIYLKGNIRVNPLAIIDAISDVSFSNNIIVGENDNTTLDCLFRISFDADKYQEQLNINPVIENIVYNNNIINFKGGITDLYNIRGDIQFIKNLTYCNNTVRAKTIKFKNRSLYSIENTKFNISNNIITTSDNTGENNKGESSIRPKLISIGFQYFDTTLNKPIWWNGTKWVDKDGNNADFKSQGTFAEKPSSSYIGFAYFCTDKQTTEGTTNGIMIYHKGENVWVDALGRVVS